MKRVTSKRPSNYFGTFGLIRPGESVVVTDEQAAGLEPEEFTVVEDESVFDEVTFTDVEVTLRAPVETRPARKAKTRK